MLGTLMMGWYMHIIGREQTIMIGMILNLVQQAGLYYTLGLHSANWFLFWSFTFQMIGGLGSGMNSVATLALIVSTSKESEREMNIGMIEMATGIGFLIGPMWGSLMYQIGGFTLPFGSMGRIRFSLF
jgi:MFS family permease